MVNNKIRQKKQKDDVKIEDFSFMEKISTKKIVGNLEEENKKEKIVGIDQLKRLLTNRAQHLNAFNLIESPKRPKKKMLRLKQNNLSCI